MTMILTTGSKLVSAFVLASAGMLLSASASQAAPIGASLVTGLPDFT